MVVNWAMDIKPSVKILRQFLFVINPRPSHLLYTYIKKCFLEPTAPKATRGDVQASLVVALDRAGNEGFTRQRLKRWLCCHVVAYFPQQTGCEVSHLIVPEGWVTADWTGRCMANGVRLATRALCWQRLWLPAITQAQSVAKCSLV